MPPSLTQRSLDRRTALRRASEQLDTLSKALDDGPAPARLAYETPDGATRGEGAEATALGAEARRAARSQLDAQPFDAAAAVQRAVDAARLVSRRLASD